MPAQLQNVEHPNNLEEQSELTVEELSTYLKIGRATLGKSIEEMSEVLGINKNTYSKYAKGVSYPRQAEIIITTMKYALKKHFKDLKEQGNFVLRDYLGELTENEKHYIVTEHTKGKNVVQIALSLSLEEEIIREYLECQHLKPLEYKID